MAPVFESCLPIKPTQSDSRNKTINRYCEIQIKVPIYGRAKVDTQYSSQTGQRQIIWVKMTGHTNECLLTATAVKDDTAEISTYYTYYAPSVANSPFWLNTFSC